MTEPINRDALTDVEERLDDLEALVPGLRQRLAETPDPDTIVCSPLDARDLTKARRKLNVVASEAEAARNGLNKPGPRFTQLMTDLDRLVSARTALEAQRETADEATTARIDHA